MTYLDGKKRFFRKHGWSRKFFERHGVTVGDVVTVEEVAPYSYRVALQRHLASSNKNKADTWRPSNCNVVEDLSYHEHGRTSVYVIIRDGIPKRSMGRMEVVNEV